VPFSRIGNVPFEVSCSLAIRQTAVTFYGLTFTQYKDDPSGGINSVSFSISVLWMKVPSGEVARITLGGPTIAQFSILLRRSDEDWRIDSMNYAHIVAGAKMARNCGTNVASLR